MGNQNITVIVKDQEKEVLRKEASAIMSIGLYQGGEKTIFQTGMDGQLNTNMVLNGISSLINLVLSSGITTEETTEDKLIYMYNLLSDIQNHVVITLQDSPYTGDLITKHGFYTLTILHGEEIYHQSTFDSLFLAIMYHQEDLTLVFSTLFTEEIRKEDSIRATATMIRNCVRRILKVNKINDFKEQLNIVNHVMSNIREKLLEALFQEIQTESWKHSFENFKETMEQVMESK
ncbi:hypothetical protein SMD22_01715 (plasmid) [Brevibacillus halotolerans]|nr:hypothetical protein SMD22_01715 [Brevibacillus halotolerans]